MFRHRLATALVAALAFTACSQADTLTAPSGSPTRDTPVPGGPRTPGFPGGSSSGGGDTTSTPPPDTTGAGDPVANGGWTSPDGTPPTIQPVDPGTFDPAGSGSAGTTGSSTALVFKTSGTGLYGQGTCSANGFWTDPNGNVFGPHNPNCIDYGTSGTGNNGKGQCVTSADGFPGLWINPGGQQTHPFHSKCAITGATTTSLVLTFSPQAQLFDANDGSGDRVLNFYSNGSVVAQLIYDGGTGTTTGAGILLGTDNASPANTWTVYFGQPALSYTTGLVNGDLIAALTSSGLEVIACSTPIGCSLVTLQLTVTP
ncbi:MAG TPA: hypothetical protein VJQ46_15855 [Gemmatimonadales bacterium]|nr:hypothetical protein [Gemmatimonadales bacterium]